VRAEIPKAAETLDVICGELAVFQAKRGYRFGVETLLLAGFIKSRASNVADLGTGSGIIPLVLTRFGKADKACGVELQPALADRARRSVRHNGLSDKIEIIEADLRALEATLPAASFDLVTANPPYSTASSGNHPALRERALAKHEITCTISDVTAAAARLLSPKGKFATVFPTSRLTELLACCKTAGLTPSRMRMIHGRIELAAKHCLLEATRGGRMGLSVESPLIVYVKSGGYTDEVNAMLYPSTTTFPDTSRTTEL